MREALKPWPIFEFPHCKWGYIGFFLSQFYKPLVPSLQVRVYHWNACRQRKTDCSLTASEGISLGYIISVIVFRCKCSVPSLYVRVYRPVRSPQKFARGFLTVCKGVSPGSAHTSMMPSFPHCMWGYIVHNRKNPYARYVPSLHVKVYRWSTGTPRMPSCSLTTCEGISI